MSARVEIAQASVNCLVLAVVIGDLAVLDPHIAQRRRPLSRPSARRVGRLGPPPVSNVQLFLPSARLHQRDVRLDQHELLDLDLLEQQRPQRHRRPQLLHRRKRRVPKSFRVGDGDGACLGLDPREDADAEPCRDLHRPAQRLGSASSSILAR